MADKLHYFMSKHENLFLRRPDVNVVEGGRTVTKPGKGIQFRQGLYETKDMEEVERVRASHYFGRTLFEYDPEEAAKNAKKNAVVANRSQDDIQEALRMLDEKRSKEAAGNQTPKAPAGMASSNGKLVKPPKP